ncbi:MAG: PDZ domain-containing protein [Planctomycetota bacterium]|nr:PDZ domain-containing protein [Planctomycetota bacterium]
MKSSLKLLAFGIAFLAIGTILGAEFLGDIQEPVDSDTPIYDQQAEVMTELRRSLNQARARIGLLEEQLEDPLLSPAFIHSGTMTAARLEALRQSGELISDTAEIKSDSTALSERLEELESELEKAKNGEIQLTDAEVQARVASLQNAFAQAAAAKDGASAMKAMMALSNLDKRAFPALIDLWSKMRENGWYGLNGGQRRLWFNAKVFHWALNSENIGGDDKSAKAFKIQALRYLPWYETDPTKQAESYAKFLEGVEKPGSELTDKEKKLLKRGWRRNGDLFRGTLSRLGSVDDAKSAKLLTRYADDLDLPIDVRAMALNGLGRQSASSRDVERIIEEGLRDQSGTIRRAATIAQVRRNPPASGLLVRGVNRKSPLYKKIGIGSVITKYNGMKIRNENDLKRALRKSKGKQITVEVNRNGIISQVNVAGGKDLRLAQERIRK